MKTILARWLLVLGVIFGLSGPAWAFEWGKLATRDNRGTVRIKVEWSEKKDVFKDGSGTGFVLSHNNYVLTVAHIIPRGPVQTLLITGETEDGGSAYPAQSFEMRVVQLNRTADFAVLAPTGDLPVLTPVPVSLNWRAKEHSSVYVRGYPLGHSLVGQGGFVTRTEMSPEVPTDILLQIGFSGAPVYLEDGTVAGMARGGVPVAHIKDPTIFGFGFFVPLSLISPAFDDAVQKGMREATGSLPVNLQNVTASLPEIRVGYQLNTVKLSPTPVLRELRFMWGKDPVRTIGETVKRWREWWRELWLPTETQRFTSGKIAAQPGYRIVAYDYREHSAAAMSEPKFVIAPDGDSMEMTYLLTSGPGYNQERGWLEATITTKQIAR